NLANTPTSNETNTSTESNLLPQINYNLFTLQKNLLRLLRDF
ncbi:38087_t:CDS:1, partial [Gigaspora margarita]